MECTQCGTVLPEDSTECPECGAAVQVPAEAPRGRGARLVGWVVIALVAIGALALAAYVTVPGLSGSGRFGNGAASSATASVEPTLTADDLDQIAAEAAVGAFYGAIGSGETTAVRSLVTTETRSAIGPALFKGWSATTFQVARSMIESDTAYVYGHESRRAFGSKTLGVKFTLKRAAQRWLVDTWQPADEGAVNGALPSAGQGAGPIALSDATASDVVSTLLQARQTGDAKTIEMLTTAAFQAAHADWLDGVDNSPAFTQFVLGAVKHKGPAYLVSASERWSGHNRRSTYTVVMQGHDILVNAWSTK
jgi:predicted nucleic acid-binding Zn ribbon protein